MGSISIITRGWVIVIIFSIGLSLVHVHGFSQSEETALATFRLRVEGTLPQEFMKSNAFLIRFLRLNNLNVGEAEAELKTYLEAREKEGVDNITPEDVRGMAKVFPFRIEGVDKQGRPIIEILHGKLQLRRLALAGKLDLAYKYFLFNFEKVLRKMIDIADTTGKDIDSFYFIGYEDGFNTRDHLCASCFPFYIRIIQLYSTIGGPFTKSARIVDAPRVFGPVAVALKQFTRSKLLDTVSVFDTNKENWQRVLAEDIDAEQLPPRLGGTNTKFH